MFGNDANNRVQKRYQQDETNDATIQARALGLSPFELRQYQNVGVIDPVDAAQLKAAGVAPWQVLEYRRRTGR